MGVEGGVGGMIGEEEGGRGRMRRLGVVRGVRLLVVVALLAL